jgi:hypothetical protein
MTDHFSREFRGHHIYIHLAFVLTRRLFRAQTTVKSASLRSTGMFRNQLGLYHPAPETARSSHDSMK